MLKDYNSMIYMEVTNYLKIAKCLLAKNLGKQEVTGFLTLISPKPFFFQKPKPAKPYSDLLVLNSLIQQSEWPINIGQSSFGIIAILYTSQACKTLFGPIKPTKPSV